MATGPEPPYEYDVFNFTFQADEGPRRSDGFRDVEEAIHQQLRGTSYVPAQDFEPDAFLTIGPRCAFRIPLLIMSKRKAFRSPESRQLFLHGWVVMHNFFAREDNPDVRVPADEAGLAAPVRSWLDVVNCRVKKAPAGDRSS